MSGANGSLFFKEALTPEGWRRDVRIAWRGAAISAVEVGAAPSADEPKAAIGLPGLVNLHSHAFQRAMAGLAERRGPGDDSFWTWREAMYRFGLTMSPDHAEAVAAQAYVEMLESGFTRVAEFHYLHHAPDGRPYADIGEMSARIAAAAERTGIGLTLLPVFYAHSDFGGIAPKPGQRRFICGLDAYGKLVQRARAIVAPLEGANLGLAPHSLRAATLEEVAEVVALAGATPIHIHIAEQTGEVEAALAWGGRRPVEMLLDAVEVDARWCLIHATHMTADETRRVALSGATAGLCAITEANLGDGMFDAPEFLSQGGKFGIGTDSNVQIDAVGELRQLEYAQRLARRARNVIAAPGGSTGLALFEGALAGGAAAAGQGRAGFQVGAAADIVTLDADALALIGRDGDALLDGWIFSGGRCIDEVYARGRRVVRKGAHIAANGIRDRFRATMLELLAL